MTELIEASASFAEQPGLRDHARPWLAWGPPARARVARRPARWPGRR